MMDTSLLESSLENVEDINHSVNVDSPIWPDYTSLHFAARCNLDAFQLLVKKGADVKAENLNKTTVFDMCMEKCNADVIRNILESNPSWSTITLSDGETKLLDVVDAIKNRLDRQSITTMSNISDINTFVPVKSKLWPGYTILHLAVILLDDNRFDDLKEQVLNRDADICALDARGWTPLHLAFRLDKQNFIVTMMNYHSQTMNPIDQDGLSHLHIACSYGSRTLIEKLLSTGTDVNNVYKGISMKSITQQSTAAHSIASNIWSVALQLLLAKGADLCAKDVNDLTPVHYLLRFKDNNPYHDDLIARFEQLKTFHSRTGLSLLHIASFSHSQVEVEQLLDLGENPNEVFTYEKKIKANDVNSNLLDYKIQSYFASLAYFRPLHFAVRSCCPAIVDLLISRGAHLLPETPKFYKGFSQDYGNSLENIVSTTKNRATLKRLHKDLNLTPLHVACCNIDVDSVKDSLLKGAADVNAQIHFDSPIWPGYTPLHVLNRNRMSKIDDADNRNISIILELLVEAGADVTITDVDKSSPLHLAFFRSRRILVVGGRTRVSKLLKSHKNFSVNPINIHGISHFYIACAFGHADIVEKFLQCGVDTDKKTDVFFNQLPSPLHISVSEWSNDAKTQSLFLKTVDLLLKYGADVSTVNYDGNTPLHVLLIKNNLSRESLEEKLIRHGSDVTALNVRGESAFELLLRTVHSNKEFESFLKHAKYLNLYNPLTKKGLIGKIFSHFNHKFNLKMVFNVMKDTPQIAKTDDMGRTAIHNVVSSQKSPHIWSKEFFLELANIVGCDINDQDVLGKTALHYALADKNEGIVSPLLEAGADPNIIDTSGNAALHIAVRYNNANVTTALLAAAADANIINTEGDSVLHIAVKNNSSAALSVLLQSGEDIDVKNAEDKTAFQVLLELDYPADFELRRTFAAHISKLQSSGFNLSEQSIDLTTYNIYNHLDCPQVFKQQLEKTKDLNIEPYPLSLYNYFSKVHEMLNNPYAPLLRAVNDFSMSFQSKEFQENFSEMMPVINTLFKKVAKILKFVDQMKVSVDRLAKVPLPDPCFRTIMKYLDKISMENFIAAMSI